MKDWNQSQDLLLLNELQKYVIDLSGQSNTPFSYSNLTLNGHTPDRRNLRVNILDCERLLALPQLHFVGFFGQKKPSIEPAINQQIARLDRRLSNSLSHYPFILSYSSMELTDHYNWANLVIFSEIAGIEQWKQTYHHKRASKAVSPQFYDNVRIHMGTLEVGLSGALSVNHTNFYDFSNPALYNHTPSIAAGLEHALAS